MEHHTREPHDVRTDTHAPETAPGAHGHHSSPRAGEHPRAGEWARGARRAVRHRDRPALRAAAPHRGGSRGGGGTGVRQR
ncbi:hypothetical protein ABH917_002122 [Thermobifida halotolerans]